MPTREQLWGVLGAIAALAFVTASVLAGVSLLLYAIGRWQGQLAVAAVVDLFLSVFFLIAGVGMLFGVSRVARHRVEPMVARILFVVCGLIAGICWTTIGVRGLVGPMLQRVLRAG